VLSTSHRIIAPMMIVLVPLAGCGPVASKTTPTQTAAPPATPVPRTPTPRPQPTVDSGGRILFIGNSRTFVGYLPAMFAELARSGGREVSVDSSAMGGYTLEQHARDRHAREKLDRAAWDIVVLQESIRAFTVESTRNTQMAPAARALDERIRSQGAQTVLVLMWASIEAVDELALAHFASEQAQSTAALRQLVQELDILIAPVGPAWEKSLRQRPELELWDSDNHHACPAGTCLMACVLYATIYQQSPVGLRFTADLPEETVLFLQEIAEGKLN
jgi:hypothetical protein